MCMTFKEFFLTGRKLRELSNKELLELREDTKVTAGECIAVEEEILRRIK